MHFVTPGEQSGQYLLRLITAKLTGLQQQGVSIKFHWVPSHRGVPGNKEADKLAKASVQEWRTLEAERCITGPHVQPSLVAALKQAINQAVIDEWKQLWKDSERGQQLFKVAPEQENLNTPKPI